MTDTTQTADERDHVFIFDTTLRDGEQSPGATMTLEEKLQVADLLDAMGVDIIEAGFPIASNGDFEAVSKIAERAENAVIAGLARAIPGDIDRAGEAVRKARRGRIIPSSRRRRSTWNSRWARARKRCWRSLPGR